MRKYILFYLTLILFTTNLFGQGDFAPTGATWYFSYYNYDSTVDAYSRYTSLGDTIVDGHSCKKIEAFVPVDAYGVPDTFRFYFYTYYDSNIVYYRLDSDFSVLYDFNKNAGEYWIDSGIEDTVFVDSVSLTHISGKTLKTLHFHNSNHSYTFSGIAIEEIGWTLYFYPDFTDEAPAQYGELRCYQDDSINYIVNPPCDKIIVGIPNYYFDYGVNIFPNPTNDFITIVLSDLKNATIEITNVNGQILQKKKIINSEVFDFSDYSQGVYFVRVIGDSTMTVNKILKY
jgi:hypothetical protein